MKDGRVASARSPCFRPVTVLPGVRPVGDGPRSLEEGPAVPGRGLSACPSSGGNPDRGPALRPAPLRLRPARPALRARAPTCAPRRCPRCAWRARRRCARSSPPALAESRTVLAVTATDREAEDLGAAAADLIDAHAVAVLPSWETLPHERLSPRPDTVGRRLTLFRRLATRRHPPACWSCRRPQPDPADRPRPRRARARPPARRRHPRLRRPARAPGRAGLHAGRDGHRARRVRRARRHRRHLPAHRRAPRARRVLGRRGQRAARVRRRRPALHRTPSTSSHAPGCRELLLTDRRPRAGRRARPHAREQPAAARAAGAPGPGHPRRGHGVAHPGAGRGRAASCSPTCCPPARRCCRRPGADPHPQRRPRPHRPGVPRGELVRRGHGRRRPDRRRRVGLPRPRRRARARRGDRAPGRHAEPAALGPRRRAGRRAGAARGHGRTAATPTARSSTCAPTSPPAAPPCSCVGGHGTAQRAMEQLRDAEVPAVLADELPDAPEPGLVTVTCGRLEEGFDHGQRLRGAHRGRPHRQPRRATTGPAQPAPQRRRNAVDLVTLKPGDYVVHAQHGIGRFVEMRAAHGAAAPPASTWCWSTRRRKRGQPADRLFVPTDALDEVSRYVGGEVPDAQQARRRRLGQDEGPRAQGRPADRRPARAALRRPPVRARARVRARTPRGSASWRTRSRTPRRPTSCRRSTRSRRTWSGRSRWTG